MNKNKKEIKKEKINDEKKKERKNGVNKELTH